MNLAIPILSYALTSLVAGLLGGAVMVLVMRLIGRADPEKGDMIVALGSLVTKSRENAWRTGAVLHAISSIGFGLVYAGLLFVLGYTHLPLSMMLGLGVGIFHGLLASLMLVWVVAEKHPLEEFNEAGLAIGLSHFAGHVAYGAVVGLVVGLSPL